MSDILTPETTGTRQTASHRVSQTGWLGRVFAKPPSHFVGIDFGIPHVHVATLADDVSDRSAAFSNQHRHRYDLPLDPFDAVTPQSIDHMIERMCDTLPRCVEGEKNIAWLSVPTPWIYYETSTSDHNSDSTTAIRPELQNRCDQMFASSAFRSHAHVSHWPIAKDAGMRMVAATASDTVCRIAERVSSVGYQVQSVLPHGVALALATPVLTTLSPASIVLLNRVGGLVSIVQDGHCGLCRTLPSCPRQYAFTNQIEPLSSWIDQVASEVIATIKFSGRNHVTIDQNAIVMLCGELAEIDNIDLALADRLGRPVATWAFADDNRSVTESTGRDAACGDAAMAVALSLAFAAATQSSRHVNPGALA